MKHHLIALLAGSFLMSACSWVELTPEGKKVRVLEAHEVTSCRVIGKTTATVTDTVAGLKRKEHILKDNLETLARNSASEMGGDTIVPFSKIEDGKQTFKVYRCVGQ
jgi:hypothetical protein